VATNLKFNKLIAMSADYKNHHYVPVWYQKRFLPYGQKDQEIYYLDFQPEKFKDSKGILHSDRAVRRQGFRLCFAEDDLYTTRFGAEESKNIEKHFFGEIDNNGSKAVEYFTNFENMSSDGEKAFQNLMQYMSTQKLRTIKGLEWLAIQTGAQDKRQILSLMIRLQQLHCAIWTECIWLIADATKSETKFILSDHPITVYNRRCGPRSQWCRGVNDPDIRYHATHTIFPLSLEKILILTNLSWVKNPYQSEVGVRPNPNPFRGALFNATSIQVMRYLSERELREINFIIKSRARRYIGAGREDWLFPEKYVSKADWYKFGNGYLLMPDPRAVYLGGDVFIRYKDGNSTAFDPYGRRPWQSGFGRDSSADGKTLFRFQGEFAQLFGPFRRGRTNHFGRLDKERDSDELHQYHLSLAKKKHN
jgi:hypothetical protein